MDTTEFTPLPGTPGSGARGEGLESRLASSTHPQPLFPQYRGEGRTSFFFPCLLLIASGCGWSRSQSMPSDPLLVSRKPVEAEAVAAPPVQLAYSEPTAPLHPYEAALAAQRAKENEQATPTTSPGVLTSTPNDN